MGLRLDKGRKNRKFIGLLAIILLQTSLFSQAREEGSGSGISKTTKANTKSGFDLDNVIVGGGFGLQFGTVTLVEVSPTIAYKLTDNFLAGVGGRYIYFEDNSTIQSFKTNIYGGNIFSQYFFLEYFLAHVEYELLNLQPFINETDRINISSFFVGGGYRSSLGGNSYASILLLYNLNDDINSPYTNPVIRVGFGFGL